MKAITERASGWFRKYGTDEKSQNIRKVSVFRMFRVFSFVPYFLFYF
jgi:hypothetical protein